MMFSVTYVKYLELRAGELISDSEPWLEIELAGFFGGEGKIKAFFSSKSPSDGFDGVKTIGAKQSKFFASNISPFCSSSAGSISYSNFTGLFDCLKIH